MPRHSYIPGWVVVPGCQGPAAERRQVAAADMSTASEHRRPRGIEGARPGPGLMRAERGNLARVRPAGTGRCRPVGRPIVRGAEAPGGTGCPGSECRRPKGSRKASAAGPGLLPDGARITGRIASLMLGPARALTWAGEPLRRSERKGPIISRPAAHCSMSTGRASCPSGDCAGLFCWGTSGQSRMILPSPSVWDEATGSFLDPAAGELLPTWAQALDAIGPNDEPHYVVGILFPPSIIGTALVGAADPLPRAIARALRPNARATRIAAIMSTSANTIAGPR